MLSRAKLATEGSQNSTNLRLLAGLLMLSSAYLLYAAPAIAQQKPSATIDKAHIVLGPPTIKVHGAYLELSNPTQTKITITGASSKEYHRIEIHRSKVEGGVAIMEPVENLVVEAGQSLAFKAGGLHLMLIGPKRTMAPKEKIVLTLHLDNSRRISAPFTVMRRHGMAPQTDGHDHAKHDH